MTIAVEPAPHECGANLIYADHDLQPYFALDRRVKDGDGSIKTSMTVGDESWTVVLSYQDSGLKPRDTDDFRLENVREFNLKLLADDDVGERGGTLHIAPRWPNMESKDDDAADPSSPDGLVGVNVRINASNIGLDEYPHLLWMAARALDINPDYFADTHEYSNIYAFERYLRLARHRTKKLIGSGGTLERVFESAANSDGKFRGLREDNTKIQGYHYRVTLDSRGVNNLLGHNAAKKIKHYHPEYPRKDPSDPLYHPKLGASLDSKHNADGTVPWSDRHSLQQELDETLTNLVSWSGMQIDRGGPFISDEYFDAAGEADLSVEVVDDPTPDLRREQDAVVSGHLMGMTDSDHDSLDVMADGGVPTVDELANQAGWSKRTIYNVLDRLGDVLRLDAGEVRFQSEHLEQRVRDALGTAKQAVNHDSDAGDSALTRWRHRYGVEMDDRGARLLLRFGEVGDLDLRNALKDGLTAWERSHRDPAAFRKARIELSRNGVDEVIPAGINPRR